MEVHEETQSILALVSALHMKLDQQRLAVRHADTLKILGTPFSGVPLCGRSVELVVHCPFDSSGVLKGSQDGDIVVVIVDEGLTDAITRRGTASSIFSIEGIIAVGTMGVAVGVTDIAGVVELLDRIVCDNGGCCASDRMELYRIPLVLQPMALAILNGYDQKAAWVALTPSIRCVLWAERNMPDTFFTSERLQAW